MIGADTQTVELCTCRLGITIANLRDVSCSTPQVAAASTIADATSVGFAAIFVSLLGLTTCAGFTTGAIPDVDQA